MPPILYPLRLSQTHLNLLEACPRKFQHTHLEQLAIATDLDQQEKRVFGEQFHLLMQQHYLGLSVEPMLQAEPMLQQSFAAFAKAEPEILLTDPASIRQSEHVRTIEFQGYLLTVVFDLLVLGTNYAQILDWKTYAKPQTPRWLQENWQTRLYPFVLFETSSYLPEQISMTYWFFQAQTEANTPQKLHLPYSAAQHDRTCQDLTNRLTQLTKWLQRYEQGEPLPQVPLGSRLCETCNFAVRCDRLDPDQTNQSEPFLVKDLAKIPEISL
jgi:hypothetical protein